MSSDEAFSSQVGGEAMNRGTSAGEPGKRSLTVATWNVNSLRARHERVMAWLDARKPDLLCLQELKGEEAVFPHEAFASRGYASLAVGQKTYNGVAVLCRVDAAPTDVRGAAGESASKQGAAGADAAIHRDADAMATQDAGPMLHSMAWLEDTLPGDETDEQARFLVTHLTMAPQAGSSPAGLHEHGLDVACVYVPNGSDVASDKFRYKQAWLARLHAWLTSRQEGARQHVPLLLCGDFNIAPQDIDAAHPEAWKASVLSVPRMREAFASLCEAGALCDAFRALHPTQQTYTWWDYRQLAFPKNDGLRIDHVLMSSSIVDKLSGAWVDRDERKGKGASDHAPLVIELVP